ncbi:D-alanyl-D-alanine carboxypeptidase [Kitasatospora sp. NPDC094015]|uniref:D-alanyl-D-alanine carboxypeptidase n=1 Tax=Kitasatospora sp. NPDC094015 TaxID=3155205 RepID=UPI0033330A2A
MGESPDRVRNDGENGPVESEPTGSQAGSSSSTVQLRVQDVDSRTTALRLPVDNATTALRLPKEVTAPPAKPAPQPADPPEQDGPDADEPSAQEPSADAAEPARTPESAERPAAADPRLAMRDGRERAGAGLKESRPAAVEPVGPAAEEATTTPMSRPERPAGAGAAAEAPAGEAETAAEPVAESASEPIAEPAKPAAAKPAAEREPVAVPAAPPLPPTVPQPAARPAAPAAPSAASPAAAAAAPAAGRAAGAPPVPPAPVAAPPAPAAAPDPEPWPAPGPENTVEAMEVLAALSRRPVTPFQRAVKRATIWTVFVAVVLGAVVVAQLLRPLPDPKAKLSLPGAFTFSGDQLAIPWPAKGQAAAEVVGVGSLGSSGPETPAPIASVTKVMNAYLILQAHPLKKGETGPVLTVDRQAAQESSDADQSKIPLTEGQQLNQYEALEMLMLPSANNVARLLARWDSGTEEAFVKKMNDQAAQLGMTNTTYADPAGYNNDTKSTAKDQLKLAEQVMKNDIFRQIVAEPDTKFNNQRVFNTNEILSPKNGVIGVKTGSSTPAGSCLMWAAVKDIGGTKRLILGVTLGQPATKEEPSLVKAAQPISMKIITAAQNGLAGQTLAKQGQVVGYVDDGLGGRTPVVAAKDLTVAGWSGITAHVTLDATKLGHTAKAGTQVGTVSAGEGDGRVEVPVTLQSDLAPPSIASRLFRLL